MGIEVPPRLLERMQRLALDAVREHRLPDDLAEDCVQEVIADLLADGYGGDSWPAPAEIGVRLARCAARGRQGTRRRRTREHDAARDHGRRPRPARTGRSIPALCPGLAGLAPHHPEPRRFLETLFAAARWVAHEPGVLRRGQLRAFVLGYQDRRPVTAIRALLGAPTPDATVQRLRRVSGRIERTLMRRVGLVLSPVDRRGLADRLKRAQTVRPEKENEKVATPVLEGLSVRLEEALQALFEP